MKRKSKFVAFILSVVPGLGHVYLNQTMRGTIFFVATLGVIALTVILTEMLRFFHEPVTLLLLPVIWLAALVDSMVLTDRINEQSTNEGGQLMVGNNRLDEGELTKQNRKIKAMFLSIVPGAGHMFLGFQRQGLQLMTLFFFTIFFSDWLRIDFMMFIVPIVWFYSLFDTLQKASSEEPIEDHDILFVSWLKGEKDWGITRHKIIGYGLISLGAILIINKVVFPAIGQYISWELSQYFQTALVALLLILGGIKILLGEKTKAATQSPQQEEVQQCGNGE